MWKCEREKREREREKREREGKTREKKKEEGSTVFSSQVVVIVFKIPSSSFDHSKANNASDAVLNHEDFIIVNR